jgi:hypothetical protein
VSEDASERESADSWVVPSGAGKISSEARRATHLLRRDLYQSGERTDASLRGRIERRRHARSSPPSLSPPPPRRALTEAFVAGQKS